MTTTRMSTSFRCRTCRLLRQVSYLFLNIELNPYIFSNFLNLDQITDFYFSFKVHPRTQSNEEQLERVEKDIKDAEKRKRGRKKGQMTRASLASQRSLSQGQNLHTYIFRVLKEAAPEYSISKKAIGMINEILIDKYDEFLKESRDLMIFSKKQTLGSKECESAVKLLVPGELGKQAVAEGRKALKNYSGLE